MLLQPVNLSNCRLLAAKVQEDPRAMCVRVESRTSPAGLVLRSQKDRRAEAERPMGGLAVDPATRNERDEQSSAGGAFRIWAVEKRGCCDWL